MNLALALWAYRAENGAYRGLGEGVVEVRFIVSLLVAVVVALGGLFIYGQMLEPETHMIEQEALDVSP